MAELKGINLAMQTPFDDMGAVDYGRWEELIDIYIDAGVHGLVLGAGTGQHPYLTEDECNKLYETGIRRIDGRCNSICRLTLKAQPMMKDFFDFMPILIVKLELILLDTIFPRQRGCLFLCRCIND